MDILTSSFLLAFILIIWFKTEAIVEYSSIFCPKLFKTNEYKEWRKSNVEDDYIGFLLANYYSNFFIRLISCPFCLGAWLSVFFSLFSSNLLFFAPIYIFGLIFFFLIVKLSE